MNPCWMTYETLTKIYFYFVLVTEDPAEWQIILVDHVSHDHGRWGAILWRCRLIGTLLNKLLERTWEIYWQMTMQQPATVAHVSHIWLNLFVTEVVNLNVNLNVLLTPYVKKCQHRMTLMIKCLNFRWKTKTRF